MDKFYGVEVVSAESPDDDVADLNKEVDKAMSQMRSSKKERPYKDADIKDIARRIQRCCDEIRAVLPLVAPVNVATNTGFGDEPPGQDERVDGAARDLLVYEAQVLMDLVDALVDKEE